MVLLYFFLYMFKLFIQEVVQKCSNDNDASENTELLHAWLKDGFEYISGYEKFEAEEEVDAKTIAYSIVCGIL